jgi:predicted nucleic acid-binding protein
MVVIDASLAIEVLLRTPLGTRHANRVFNEELNAPHVIDLEVAQALRRLVRGEGYDSWAAANILDELGNWSMERYAHILLLPKIWDLRDSVSAYDAAYVALAEALDAPLLTCDAKLSRSHGHRAKIELAV